RDVERSIHRALRNKARELGVFVYAIGNVEDHIHLALSIPPTIAVAECIRHLKGASSYTVNREHAGIDFAWQTGYGAFTFSDHAKPIVVAYVRNQKRHHRAGTTHPALERTPDDENEDYNE
ncbi:MAG: IS200/IS605 family transposase, partial [Roseiflexus sp.]|nr:IS200/IS605 family transposase [Roseiflexus sp.]